LGGILEGRAGIFNIWLALFDAAWVVISITGTHIYIVQLVSITTHTFLPSSRHYMVHTNPVSPSKLSKNQRSL
jgi:hypothetical protein